tara:strand:+ start:279 stop:2219 length:1941 start_codon:yes stop_codon:yes gene_type:complete
MKLDTTPQDVAVEGSFETTAFGMEASAHAFDIIADKIYTHKVRAVIREISCNAHDAHVEAGNPDPFDVHLPTQLEPHFTVRDYGVGLSDDDVRFIFCNTFKSTKQHTNDQIGCLGLGSKSPFCLSDSFTIKSWHGGMCRTYSCYRDEQRKPNVALLTETPSDESNGIEISFTIEDKSCEFEEDAVKVFRHWSYTPNINNKSVVEEIEEQRGRYKFTGEDFGLSPSYGSMKAVMGNVAYDIPDELDEFDVDGYLRFELGEISFDAGRESLSLDDRTKAAIKAKFKAVKDKLGSEASQQIDALPTAWERAKLAHDLSLGQLGKFVKTDLAKYDLPETSEEMMYFTRSYRSTDKGSTTKIPLGENISYYEHKPRFQTRIRSWLKDNYDIKTMVLLTPKQMDELDISRDIIKDLDDLPKMPSYSTGSVGGTVKTFTFDRGYSHWKDRDYWDENTTEVDGSEMVYIQLNRFQPTGESSGRIFGLSSNSEIKRMLNRLDEAGIKVPTIHGLKSVYLNTKAFKTGNYVALNDYVEREVSKIAPESKQRYDEEQFELMNGLSKRIEQEDLDMWLEIQEDEPPESLLHLVKMCRLEIEEDTLLQELQDDFFKRYPMVAFIDRWELKRNRNDESEEKIAKITHYIEGKVRDEQDEK